MRRICFIKIMIAAVLSLALLFTLAACGGKREVEGGAVSDSISTPDFDPKAVYRSDWYQVDHFICYTEGSIVSFDIDSTGIVKLSLKVFTNYHVGNDPIGNSNLPWAPGSVLTFILRRMPEIPINVGEDVVVYQSHMTTSPDGDDPIFLAAVVMYYKENEKYFDMENNEVTMPPSQCPSADVFNEKIFL